MNRKIEIFTDGACYGNPGLCAIGIVMKYGNYVKEHSRFLGNGTNNIAELTAILEALRLIKKPEMEVIIYTDSSYVIGALGGEWKVKKNRELINEIINETKRFSKLRLVKVQGHAGIEFNERADRLARESIEEAMKKFKIKTI